MVQKADKIWMDGKLINWEDANVHILTHSLHYGFALFEGIRCYECQNESSAVFRLKEHIKRLFDSAKIAMMKIPFTQEEIVQACVDTLKVNNQKSGYLRPLVFIGDGAMGLHPQDNPIRVSIITWPWGAYLGDDGMKNGIRVKISSFTRHHVNIMMTKAKISGNYVNSILAKSEVTQDGFDEALLLDAEGFVAEATGENFFIVRDNILSTPPLTSVLAGITRDSIITVARDMGYSVVERRFSRDEVYIADEAFFCGTAAELTPIREVDHRLIGEGKPGPITKNIQKIYFDIVQGKAEKYKSWLTYL